MLKRCLLSFCILCFSMVLVGCQSKGVNADPSLAYPPELQKVKKLIAKKYYKDAHGEISDYLNRSENIRYFGHAYFLQGYIYEREGEVEQAKSFYRRSIQHTNNFDGLVQAKALYNLSFTLEREGRFTELMGVLTDLIARPRYFKTLTAQVETPARMGAALASLGRLKSAEDRHAQAVKNYERLSRRGWFRPKSLDLSKALYYLGVSVYDEPDETFMSLEKKLTLGQKYFLLGAEASDGSWAQKSTLKLLNAYRRMGSFVSNYQLPPEKGLDPAAASRKKSAMQLDMASRFYDILLRVRPEEFPLQKINKNAKTLVETSDQWMRALEAFVLKLDLGPETIRSMKVRQRPLVMINDEEWKKRSTRVNKENVPAPKLIEPPLGIQWKRERKAIESLEGAQDKEKIKASVNESIQRNQHKKKIETMRKDEFRALPKKDPNL